MNEALITCGSSKGNLGGKQRLYAFTLSFIISFLPINICFNSITTSLGMNTVLDTALLYATLLSLVALSMGTIILKERFQPPIIIFVTTFIAVYALSILSDNNARYMFTTLSDLTSNPLYIVFLYNIPVFIISLHLRDVQVLSKIFKVFAYIVVISSIIVYFAFPDSSANQYMSISYNMLSHLLFLFISKQKKLKLFHYIIIGLGIFVVIFGGARGAALGLVIGIFVYLLTKKSNSIKKIIILTSIGLILIFILLFMNSIMNLAQRLLHMLGLESRTFDFLLNGVKAGNDITSGRLSIYKQILYEVGIWGRGFYADRVLLNGSYAHNIFLEFLLDFGIVFGSIVSIAYLWIIWSGIKSTAFPMWKFIIILLPTGFVAMMLSGSYLGQFPAVYALIGLCINAKQYTHSRGENEY